MRRWESHGHIKEGHIWNAGCTTFFFGGTVNTQMISMELKASELRPPAYLNGQRGITVLVHIGDLLCIGGMVASMWLYDPLMDKYELQRHVLEPGSQKEVKCLNRVLRRGLHGVWSGNVIPSMRGRCCGSVLCPSARARRIP